MVDLRHFARFMLINSSSVFYRKWYSTSLEYRSIFRIQTFLRYVAFLQISCRLISNEIKKQKYKKRASEREQ
jgi:hypothetical protein